MEHESAVALALVGRRHSRTDSVHFQPMERLKVYLFWATIVFASFGMGEAVYRILFSEFDGITDRLVRARKRRQYRLGCC